METEVQLPLLDGPTVNGDRPHAEGTRAKQSRRKYAPPAIDLGRIALDALMLVSAAIVAELVAIGQGVDSPILGWQLTFSAFVIVMQGFFGLYQPRFSSHYLDDLRLIIAATAIAVMGASFLRILTGSDTEVANQAVQGWLFATLLLAGGRGAAAAIRINALRHGGGAESTLIIGAGRVGRLVARRLEDRPEFGLRPVAFFDHDPLDTGEELELPVLGRDADDAADPRAFARRLESAIHQLNVSHVIVAFSLSSHDVELALVRRCQELGVSVSLVPRLFGGLPDQVELERLGGLPLLSVHPSDPRGFQFAAKYAADRVFAALAIVLLAPVMLACALAVRLTMGRPIFFRQRRTGMDGTEFELIKFRTMKGAQDPGASERVAGHNGLGPGGVEGEDRRTPVGAFMRRISLDELPQIFNVLKGEMSMIGPRPERPEFVRVFDRRIHRYSDRSRVKSGITGWAQVHGLRGRTSIADRAEWDNYYIENWSPWLDLKIALLTIPAMLRYRAE